MANQRIVVIGASAGGIEAVKALVKGLRSDLPFPIFLVIHLPSDAKSVLPAILNRLNTVPSHGPSAAESILPGRIYAAPPDHHMLIHDEHVLLSKAPIENGFRPSIDALFKTAAAAYGSGVIGIILTGSLHDGTAGLNAIKLCGGVAIVQNPQDAAFPNMVDHAIENCDVDHVFSIEQISDFLNNLGSTVEVSPEQQLVEERSLVAAIADPAQPGTTIENLGIGGASGFGCPACGGVLWHVDQEALDTFKCRVGHAFSANALISAQEQSVEEALWSAVRALEEKSSLSRGLAKRMKNSSSASRLANQAQKATDQAQAIRALLGRIPRTVAELKNEPDPIVYPDFTPEGERA